MNHAEAVDDAILDALAAKRRARAILIAYRRGDSASLEEAWYTINALVDHSNYDQPDQDPSFQCVSDYLSGPFEWKETKIWLGIAFLFLVAGGVLVGFKFPALRTGIQSFWWTNQTAKIVNVYLYDEQHLPQNREETWHMMNYQYEYESIRGSHKQTIKRKRYFPAVGETALAIGDEIAIVYNPNHPSQSIHERRMYHRAFGVVVGLLIMLPGFVILGFIAFFEFNYRRLRRDDVQAQALINKR